MSEPRTKTGRDLPYDKSGWVHTDRRDIVVIEDEAAQIERDDWFERFRRNHGDRGHPEPFVVCPREVCVLGRHASYLIAEPAP